MKQVCNKPLCLNELLIYCSADAEQAYERQISIVLQYN